MQQVIKTRNVEKLSTLKRETDEATIKVVHSENLVQKLENEIIEWNSFKKLCSRDEELEQIEDLATEFKSDLKNEKAKMDIELNKN